MKKLSFAMFLVLLFSVCANAQPLMDDDNDEDSFSELSLDQRRTSFYMLRFDEDSAESNFLDDTPCSISFKKKQYHVKDLSSSDEDLDGPVVNLWGKYTTQKSKEEQKRLLEKKEKIIRKNMETRERVMIYLRKSPQQIEAERKNISPSILCKEF